MLAIRNAIRNARCVHTAVFNRHVKRLHKQRSASSKNVQIYEYLREHVASIVCDRIDDLSDEQQSTIQLALDLGHGTGRHVARNLSPKLASQFKLIECESYPPSLPTTATITSSASHHNHLTVQCDEEALPFKANTFDLAISCCTLHWINQLPGTLKQIYQCLTPDSAFVGALLGGDTLFELRTALQLAELERLSGFAAHVSPMTGGQDVASLLTGAGFKMVTVDVDELRVHYPSMLELMFDLQGMAENNAVQRACVHLHRDTILAASAAYYQSYRSEDLDKQGVAATFQILHFIGWKLS